MKIMVVDDAPKMRQVIIDMLKNVGAEFIECSNGADAVAMYDRYHPDYVMMDIEMGEMNGIEATKVITRKDCRAKIYIVTNYSDQLLTKEAKDAGAIGYVLKENLHELRKIFRGQ